MLSLPDDDDDDDDDDGGGGGGGHNYQSIQVLEHMKNYEFEVEYFHTHLHTYVLPTLIAFVRPKYAFTFGIHSFVSFVHSLRGGGEEVNQRPSGPPIPAFCV